MVTRVKSPVSQLTEQLPLACPVTCKACEQQSAGVDSLRAIGQRGKLWREASQHALWSDILTDPVKSLVIYCKSTRELI